MLPTVNNEETFRIAFWTLLGAMTLMRCYFLFRVRQAGERILPDRTAIRREGWALFALRAFASLLIPSLVIYAFNPAWFRVFALPLPNELRWAGVALGLASLGLWTWTHVALGSLWSAQLQLREAHRLVSTGPYSRIRHPMYTAILGWATSLALVSANGVFAVVAGGAVAYMAARVPKEEQMMLEQFGDKYREYMKRTGRFFPR